MAQTTYVEDEDKNLDENLDNEEQLDEELDSEENAEGASAEEVEQETQGEPEEGLSDEEIAEIEGTKPEKEEETPKKTRKERRAERAKRFSDLRQEAQARDRQRQQLMQRPQYNPMDYSGAEELDVNDLQKDRTQYGDSRYHEGMQAERFYAEQERFNDKLEADNDYILSRPDYAFMDESSDNFDADLAEGINDLYLSMTGYDDQRKVFSNPNIRYKEFVPMMKSMMDKYASTRNQNTERNISRQRSQAGVRPTSGASRNTRVFTPDQIARMSQSQFEKYQDDINRQVNSML